MRLARGEDQLRQIEDFEIAIEAVIVADANQSIDVVRTFDLRCSVHPRNALLVMRAMRTLEQRCQSRIHELCIERPGEMNVLVAIGDRERFEERCERLCDGMSEQRLDRRGAEAKLTEAIVKLGDERGRLGIARDLRRLTRELERVVQRQAIRLADDLSQTVRSE